jgi:hypothetical protein
MNQTYDQASLDLTQGRYKLALQEIPRLRQEVSGQ